MLYFYIVVSAVLVSYCYIILSYFKAWSNIPEYNSGKEPISFVSVIIAFRNEAKNLNALLNSLVNQNMPESLHEIILVNDHSEDESTQIIQPFIEQYKNLKLVEAEKDSTGKKAAIRKGISLAKGTLIITTDADCTMNQDWLRTLVNYYEEMNQPDLISVPVLIEPGQSYFSKFQSFEFLSLVGSGAGSIGIYRPILCNAANLAFKKNLFKQQTSSGNNKYASGDDIFLLLYAKKNKKKIHFIKSKEAAVYTKPLKNISEFIIQRIRWISKSPGYNDFDINFVAIVVYLLNLLFVALLIAGFLKPVAFIVFILGLFIKSTIDAIFLNNLQKYFHGKVVLGIFKMHQLLNMAMTVIIPVLAIIVPLRWKGRRI